MLKNLPIDTTLSKQGSFIYNNGNTYKGNISSQNGMPHGLGTLYFKNEPFGKVNSKMGLW